LLIKYIKSVLWKVSETPVLYTGRAVPKVKYHNFVILRMSNLFIVEF